MRLLTRQEAAQLSPQMRTLRTAQLQHLVRTLEVDHHRRYHSHAARVALHEVTRPVIFALPRDTRGRFTTTNRNTNTEKRTA